MLNIFDHFLFIMLIRFFQFSVYMCKVKEIHDVKYVFILGFTLYITLYI